MNDRRHYMRNAKRVVLTSGARVILVGEDDAVLRLATPHVQKWSLLMQRLSQPLPGAAVRELWTQMEGDDALWRRLVGEGYVLEAEDGATLLSARNRVFFENQGFDFVPQPPQCKHLIVACSGSVVAGLVAPAILSLLYSGFQSRLDVFLTPSGQKFVTRDLFESYGIRTWVDAFERKDGIYVPHVQLGRSADCILVLPATANALHRVADAACTDLLSMTVAATAAPVVFAPAMNEAMWNQPGVQRNLQRLRDDGRYILEPTLIFGAADVAAQGAAMFGGHGILWGGPRSLKRALAAVLGGVPGAA
jgi:hypothetical protein